MIALTFHLDPPQRKIEDLELITGLIWIPALLTPTQQRRLRVFLSGSPWSSPPRLPKHHSQQCYGWVEKPPENRAFLNPHQDYLGALPDGLNGVLRRLQPWMPHCDQVVAYATMASPTEGDVPSRLHLDHTGNFGNAISMVALSALKLRFRRGMRDPVTVELDAGDALVMQDEARYQWLHQVVFEASLSQLFLTFRTVRVGEGV